MCVEERMTFEIYESIINAEQINYVYIGCYARFQGKSNVTCF